MKISVILTAYNAAAYLREELDSILAQEYKDWEAICVDDGSTDATSSILDEYAARDHRIKVVHQANKGVSTARNAGLALATGDYMTFCDADDLISPYWFSNAAKLIEEIKPDLLRACLSFGRTMPLEFLKERKPRIEQMSSGQRDCMLWAWRVFFTGGFPVLNFIKANLRPFIKFPEQMSQKEDTVMLVNLAPHLRKVVQSDYCGYFYRNTQGSLIRSKRASKTSVLCLNSMCEVWGRQRELASQLGVERELMSSIQRFSDNDVIDWAIDSAREPKEAKRQVRQAWIALRDAGAFDGRYHNRTLFYLPFQWWKLTGQEMWLKLVWKMFLVVRKIVKG